MNDKYLRKTRMIDYEDPSIQQLIAERGWNLLPEPERVRNIYDFVRDEIFFGYNIDDDIPASRVLKDGYGQCNTKGFLWLCFVLATSPAECMALRSIRNFKKVP